MSVDPLSVGLSGLAAYDEQLAVSANNVANVESTGFQGQSVTFQDVFARVSGSGAATGGGVSVATIDANPAQGGIMLTGNGTDLAINGTGFFVVQAPGGASAPAYTRDGHFSLDANGFLIDAATGLALTGFPANASGAVSGGAPQPLQIPLGLTSQAVGTGFGPKSGPPGDQSFDVTFGGNLDQTLYQQAAAGPAQPVTLSTTVYDSLGVAHAVNVTFAPVTVGAGGVNPVTQTVNNTHGIATSVGTEWGWTAAKANPADPMVVPPVTGYVFFDRNGQFINTSSDPTGQTNTHAAGPVNPSGIEGNALNIANWGTPTDNAVPASIALGFASMDSLAGASTATTVAQNGSAPGTLQNITVGQNGIVTGTFSNGRQATLAQVALATFQNPGGLQRSGSGLLNATAASGLAQIGAPGSGILGGLIGGALETSNVSLSDEIVKMMIAQRAFQANAKSVTTGEQNIETILKL